MDMLVLFTEAKIISGCKVLQCACLKKKEREVLTFDNLLSTKNTKLGNNRQKSTKELSTLSAANMVLTANFETKATSVWTTP